MQKYFENTKPAIKNSIKMLRIYYSKDVCNLIEMCLSLESDIDPIT